MQQILQIGSSFIHAIYSEFKPHVEYLKDSNAAAHSVDSDIFYVVIKLDARSTSYHN